MQSKGKKKKQKEPLEPVDSGFHGRAPLPLSLARSKAQTLIARSRSNKTIEGSFVADTEVCDCKQVQSNASKILCHCIASQGGAGQAAIIGSANYSLPPHQPYRCCSCCCGGCFVASPWMRFAWLRRWRRSSVGPQTLGQQGRKDFGSRQFQTEQDVRWGADRGGPGSVRGGRDG